MFKKIIIAILILIAILAICAKLLLTKKSENFVGYSFEKARLSVNYPESMSISESGKVLLEISDSNISLIIKRIIHDTDPSRTGGDRCLPPPLNTPLTEIGSLDGKTIYRGQRAGVTNYEYFANDLKQTCYLMPLFTKKFPEFDNISVNFTFKSPNLSDLEKQKYMQIADQIVLSLKDTGKL
ncbi:MAG: hypothetical protein WCO78_05160 [Candidatus Roizmanbacteria bacterium]